MLPTVVDNSYNFGYIHKSLFGHEIPIGSSVRFFFPHITKWKAFSTKKKNGTIVCVHLARWSISIDVGLLLLQYWRYKSNIRHWLIFESKHWITVSGIDLWLISARCVEICGQTKRTQWTGLLYGRRRQRYWINYSMGYEFWYELFNWMAFNEHEKYPSV